MTLTLLDWRRRVAALYAAARTASDPEAGWRTWRDGRDELFATHPDSPLDEEARTTFRGLPFAPYDPALRFAAVVERAEPQRIESSVSRRSSFSSSSSYSCRAATSRSSSTS